MTTARRSFLAQGALVVGAAGFITAPADAQPTQGARWQPAREPKDDWLDQVPGKHRIFFDATSAQGAEESALFAGNCYRGNKDDYGLEPKELAVVISLSAISRRRLPSAMRPGRSTAAPSPTRSR